MGSIAKQFLASADENELVKSGLHYGVEIEFSNAGDLANVQVVTDEQCREHVHNVHIQERLVDLWSRDRRFRCIYTINIWDAHIQTALRAIADIVDSNSGLDYEDSVNQLTSGDYNTLVSNANDTLVSELESDSFDSVCGWENKEDSTSGIVQEYATETPTDYNGLEEHVRTLFRRAGGNRNVPSNGSNHIHVSIPGVRHQVSQDSKLHCCILFELAKLCGESDFPERLLCRWVNHENYFNFEANPGTKFSAVHCHPQGSWEFRLWGGMSCTSDIMHVVEISGLAIVRGYKRYYAGDYRVDNVVEYRHLFADYMRGLANNENVELSSVDVNPSIMDHIGNGSFPFYNREEFDRFQRSTTVSANALSYMIPLDSVFVKY